MEQTLLARSITKTFPGVQALDHVEFDGFRGEVHALIGENGAGKSTLMKILAGVYRPDSGDLFVKGKRVAVFDPRYAQDLGISIIYQELSLLPYLRVAENILLGREPRDRFRLIDYRLMERRAAEILDQLDGHIDPRAFVHRLSPAQRQLVEIAKALSLNADTMIMDEPSSSLAEHELQRLFEVIRSLKQRGVTVIYISHRLEEVLEIADRVTVLRDGKVVNTLSIRDVDRSSLIRMMVGRDIQVDVSPQSGSDGDVVLQVKGLSQSGTFKNVDLTLHQGEILGVAGLIGAGRTEVARAIFGADSVDSGEVILKGQRVQLTNPRAAIDRGVVLVPEERKAQGLILIHTLRENISLPSLKRLQRWGFVKEAEERKIANESIEQLKIHAAGPDQEVIYLSGGNQQKVVLAKWLNAGPEVIIFDEPTRGIDVGAKAEIYHVMRQLAQAGKAIMMISSELPEILNLSDRIVVLSGGQIAGELKAHQATEENVLALAYQNVAVGQAKVAPAEQVSGGLRSSFRVKLRTLWGRSDSGNRIVYMILAVLFLLGTVGSERFLSVPNLMNLLRQMVIPLLLGIGQTFVILSGGIDLSVSSVVTLSNVFAAGMMAGQDARLLPVAVVCLSVGLLAGATNALVIIKLRVVPIIATLGMMVIGQGIALIYTREPIGIIPRSLMALAQGRIGELPTSTLWMTLIIAAAMILLYKASYGRHLYAVGGDDEIARISGISVNRVRATAYLVSGLLAAMTGLYLTSRMGSGDPSVGPGLELDSIAAVLLGGTILGGGRGGLIGTIAGVLVLVLLNNVFNQLGLNVWYQQIAKGIIIVLAVTIYRRKS